MNPSKRRKTSHPPHPSGKAVPNGRKEREPVDSVDQSESDSDAQSSTGEEPTAAQNAQAENGTGNPKAKTFKELVCCDHVVYALSLARSSWLLASEPTNTFCRAW